MPRIVGVDIPNDKSIWISLTYIVGIGKHTSEQILKEAGIEGKSKAGKLSEDELSRITQIIDRNYTVEGQLRRQVSQNIARLRDIVTEEVCPFGVSVPRVMHAPAKGPEKQSLARRV